MERTNYPKLENGSWQITQNLRESDNKEVIMETFFILYDINIYYISY